MSKVLVVATGNKTRGGITAVLRLYERSKMWRNYNCKWIGTHRDGNVFRKLWYLVKGYVQYVVLLPFYDIVHFHISLPMTVRRKYPLFKMAKLLNKKIVIHLHCGSQINDIWNEKYQYMFEKCDCGILLSESLKRKVEGFIGVSDKLRVVYNPCPIITEPQEYEKQNYILYSGTLYEGKGYKDLINAFQMIASVHKDWKLVMAGNGEVENAKELARELKIDTQVILLGWVAGEAKHKIFKEAKILCLPSYAEGFPMAVLDAWAYGLPVITTPVGGVSDIAVDGENMLLFEPGNIKVLSEKIDTLIRNEQLRKKMMKESKKLADSLFCLDVVTQKIAEIYDHLYED